MQGIPLCCANLFWRQKVPSAHFKDILSLEIVFFNDFIDLPNVSLNYLLYELLVRSQRNAFREL
jgi:hypothetical protein